MSTISNAVQVMVDNLVAKMASNTPLTPEEQSMVAEAIALLSKSTTLETALIAVAEKHLDTATSALDSAKVSLQENADYLKLLPQINEIKDAFSQIKTGLDNTLGNLPAVMREGAPVTPALAFNWNGADLLRITGGSSNAGLYESLPTTVTSLFDDDEKCFYVFIGFGSNTAYYSKDSILKIDATGSRSMVSAGKNRISGNAGESFQFIKTHAGVRLAKMSASSLTFYGVMPSLTAMNTSIPVTEGRIYQEPDTLNFWSYSNGETKHSVWNEEAQIYVTTTSTENTFLVAANFNDWAEKQNFICLLQSNGSVGQLTYRSLSPAGLGGSNQIFSSNSVLSSSHYWLISGKYLTNHLSDTFAEVITWGPGHFKSAGLEKVPNLIQCHSVFESMGEGGAVLPFSGIMGRSQNLYSSSSSTTSISYCRCPALIAVSPYHRMAVISLGRQGNYNSSLTASEQKTVVRAF